MAVTTRGLELPPAFRAIALREHQDAFNHARAIAAEEGAGTLVWVRRFDTAEFAIVVEPDEPLREARRVLYAAMAAAGDALATYSPPEKPLSFGWPSTLLFDGGVIGGLRLACPENASETEVPDWLVIGFLMRTVLPLKAGTPFALDAAGIQGTSLESEGFDMLDQAELIASVARHFMVYVDLWQEKGFVPVGQAYLARLPDQKGVRHGIDVNGDLLLRMLPKLHEVESRDLKAALAAPEWLDPATGEPLL
jgi:biotin-(acetyl-CoA carboxylase) ligase